jgi:hypothetical protein
MAQFPIKTVDVELLAKRCLIETWRETQLYRLKPKK